MAATTTATYFNSMEQNFSGAFPNVVLPTLGGKQIWADLLIYSRFRIQENVITRHCRLLGPKDSRLAWGSFEHCEATLERLLAQNPVELKSDHLVLLLHGMFRSKEAFSPMTRAFRTNGYEAAAINYPSTRRSIEQHANQIDHILEHAPKDIRRVSFITHSLGGLVARTVLGRQDQPWRQNIKVHRLVLIATPNQGAALAERLGKLQAFHTIGGPVTTELYPEHVQQNIPTPTCPFAIVAGGRSNNKGFNPFLPGDDDLTVTVDEAHLEGAEDILVVNTLHTFVMIHPAVIRLTQHYLETGKFME
ncbi:MAG: alpha/beta fold hydrolase [Proteobacteria bacterium]|nr:alpha/beta fold hydrolase [Pseudomonadota bacterium]